MIEEILPELYRIQVTLPRSPLKFTNSYVIKNKKRCLVIDTGMNRKECLDDITAGLHELGIDLANTDFFITHFHADHLGLIGSLATPSSKVYFNKLEARIVEPEYWASRIPRIDAFYRASGFPEAEFERALAIHPGRLYSLNSRMSFSIVGEGDKLEIGDYNFQCIETPGHSPGHICLYEPAQKILVSGDHILFDITPNITWWLEIGQSLRHYLASLEKVRRLDVRLVLPGHRSLSDKLQQRIEEIAQHHRNRLGEALAALADGPKTAYQVAPAIKWDIKCSSWEAFPTAQKWFAIGETTAHLEYLIGEGKIATADRQGITYYSLK